ncbi:MAG: GHKL domain-containing protein [Clostridia bacterium]|nr:GHKL domain-containing protein [Clostridia bacterium]
MTMGTIVNLLSGVVEAIITLMLIKVYTEKPRPFYAYVLGALVLAGITMLSNYFFNIGYLNLFILILMVFSVSAVFTKSVKQGIQIGAITMAVFLTTEFVVLSLMSLLTGITVEDATNIENARITGTILSKLLAYVIMKVICTRHRSSRDVALKASYWILFFVIFMISTMSIYVLYILQYYSVAPKFYNTLANWCSLGLSFATFFYLYLYEKIVRQAAEEKKQEILRQQVRAQAKHMDEILMAQTEVKKLRHDLKNHNISIKAYLEQNDCAGALAYLEGIQENSAFHEKFFDTGNITLDAILNTKRQIAQSRGIDLSVLLQIPENLFLDPIDICVLFGNALDNAIEACERMQSGHKWVKLSATYEKGTLYCKISNSAEKTEGGFLQTAKKGNGKHGFGIGNMEATLVKYDSVHTFEQTDEEFSFFFQITER